jgi:hypothetical protein
MTTVARVQRTFLAIFIVFLCLPVGQMLVPVVQYAPVVENRARLTMPNDPIHLFVGPGDFARRFEEFFNDRYGFRDLLIRTRNQIDYALFRTSQTIFIGKRGFLFYRNVEEGHALADQRSSEAEAQIRRNVQAFVQLVRSRGLVPIFMPMPLKSTIYPEMLPATAPRRKSPSNFDQHLAFLKSLPDLAVIDSTEIARQWKAQRKPVFHKTDFHWNEAIGAAVAERLINLLGELSGTGVTWNPRALTIVNGRHTGGEADMMALLFPPWEQRPVIELQPFKFEGTLEFTPNVANEWLYTAHPNAPPPLLPGTVMFGDSFADPFLRAGFTRYFKRFEKHSNYTIAQQFGKVPPDSRFLIIEYIESMVQLMSDPGFFPQ